MSVLTKAETNTPDEELVNALDEVIELVEVMTTKSLPDGYNKTGILSIFHNP